VKTKSTKGHRQFEINTLACGNCYYPDSIADLEKLLARKPRSLQINLIGAGEVPADIALLMRSMLRERSPKTRLVTNARSSLQNGAVLVWLLGDTRMIRDDARLFFRRSTLPANDEHKPKEVWKDDDLKYCDSYSEIEPEEGDYARVLELINEFLPVKELAGRLIEVPVLRQFGLVENEKVDQFLATVFARKPEPNDVQPNRPEEKRTRWKVEVLRKRQANR
jgi:hypothetical protein